MAKYFTDFSSDTIGLLPAGWTASNCTAAVASDGLALAVSARFAAIYYTGIPFSGVTEVYAQFKTSSFGAYIEGIGAAIGEGAGDDRSNVSALYATTTTAASATRYGIDIGFTKYGTVTITALPAATTVFNTLLQLDGPVVAGGAFTAKAWFWPEGATPKTSASTPDVTYSSTYNHTHTAYPGFSQDANTSSATLLKFGVGNNGDQAPQSGPSAGVSSEIGFDINSLTFGINAGSTLNVSASVAFDINDLTFGVSAAITQNASASASFDINDLTFGLVAGVFRDVSATASFDINDLTFGVVASSTLNVSAVTSFDINQLTFGVSARKATDATSIIGFDINDLTFGVRSLAQSTPFVNPYSIPGMNIYRAAIKVIATDNLKWFTFSSRVRNALGNWITTYSAPVEIRGSVQPVEIRAYKELGLDMSKRYVTLFTDHNAKHVTRGTAPDRFEWDGGIWESIGGDDWFVQDGWRECVLVFIDYVEVLP